MGKSLNKQEETFAQAMAAGKGPSASYREAYPSKMGAKAVAGNAKRLLKRPHVRARLEALGKESRESGEPSEPTGASGLAPSETELRVKQERFLQLFLEKGNASEAYRQAYDVSPNTRPETIHRCAAELLANPKVTTRLNELRAEMRKRAEITLDHLVEALRPLAFGDIRRVATWGDAVPIKDPETGAITIAQGVVIKSSAELDDAAAAMIAELIPTKDGPRVKLFDRITAVEKMARLLGLIKDQHEHSGSIAVKAPPQPRLPRKEDIEQWFANYVNAAKRSDK